MRYEKNITPNIFYSFYSTIILISHFPCCFSSHDNNVPPYTWIEISFIIFGVGINLWTDAIFKKNNTTVKPHEKPTRLITSGPFLLSRHPMCLGMLMILLGISIFLGSLIVYFFPILFIGIIEKCFIPMEEKNLETLFGQKYLAYKNKVRRWM